MWKLAVMIVGFWLLIQKCIYIIFLVRDSQEGVQMVAYYKLIRMYIVTKSLYYKSNLL